MASFRQFNILMKKIIIIRFLQIIRKGHQHILNLFFLVPNLSHNLRSFHSIFNTNTYIIQKIIELPILKLFLISLCTRNGGVMNPLKIGWKLFKLWFVEKRLYYIKNSFINENLENLILSKLFIYFTLKRISHRYIYFRLYYFFSWIL